MAKNIDIHIKTRGAQQSKQDLDGVAKGAKRTGDSAEKMGKKGQRGAGWLSAAFGKIVGPLGFAAIVTAAIAATVKVAKFFDDLKKKSDEAVRNLQSIRAAFTDLFEAMDAFDEKTRMKVTGEAFGLLKEVSVSKEIGLPVINAYTRQFKSLVESGQLTEEQYQQGLKGMLGYAERHGGAATTDLISIMAGWGMVTPEQQGAFRRQIAAGAAASGLTDEELIGALGRGMPTIKAMGWTPEQAVETIATIARGEVGRKKAGLPAQVLQALMAPQLSNIEKLGIPEEIAQDPQKLLAYLTAMRATMDQKAFTRMLVSIYGMEAGAGVSKLLTAPPRGGIARALVEAAGAEGAKAEQEEERTSRLTQERRKAKAEAAAAEEDLDIKLKEQYETDIRDIGEAKRKRLERREPFRQKFRQWFTTEEVEKEYGAYRKWLDSLSEEEKRAIARRPPLPYPLSTVSPFRREWEKMTAQERFEELTDQPSAATNIHYHNEIITNHNPIAGTNEDRGIGPRVSF